MSEFKICNDGHEMILVIISHKCPLCAEQEKVLIAERESEDVKKELQDVIDKIKALADGL